MEALRAYLKERKVVLTEEQFNTYASFFQPKKIKKGAFLLSEGEVDKYLAFVVKGCLRLYTIDNKGKEHIMQFAPENWWISDMDSLSKGTPSLYFIDALEDSDLLLIEGASQEKALCDIQPLTFFFQQLMQNRQLASQKRIIHSMSASAEERYLDFLKTYPSINQRVPQHMIASYLGITPESLSRIRKQVAHPTLPKGGLKKDPK
jgi:CRP-like cAMP-binding protein